ncbi:MAG: glycosyltransferase family 2 protein [Thermodesulfovibrio sp.]
MYSGILFIYIGYIFTLDIFSAILNTVSLLFLALETFFLFDMNQNKINSKKEGYKDLDKSDPYTPKVSIHIPVCKEPPEVVRETLRALSQLDYPNYEVCVIVNNTTENELVTPVYEECKRLGNKFRFFHLPKIEGYKAGALNFALSITDKDAELIAVVDSDYVVSKDFLKKAVQYFKDPQVAIVQLPQDYRDFPSTPWFEGMYYAYRYFFSIVMNSCNRYNAASFMGTMGVVRRKYLEEVGGWCKEVITEDSELGMRIHAKGYKSIYIDESYGKGFMPFDFYSYKKQRFRWAFGNMQTLKKNIALLFSKHLTWQQKLCYLGSNTIWFNNLLLPFLWSILCLTFNLPDKFIKGIVSCYISFLTTKFVAFVIIFPKVFGISKLKGFWALLSFLSITFPMSTAWLLCLIKSKATFWKTPKAIKVNNIKILNYLKQAKTELLILLVSFGIIIVGVVQLNIWIVLIGMINFFIYSPCIWALVEFSKFHKRKKEIKDEDRNYFSSLEACTS